MRCILCDSNRLLIFLDLGVASACQKFFTADLELAATAMNSRG